MILPRIPASSMTCQDFTEGITDYLEGDLLPDRRVGARFHLGLCTACRVSLLQMQQTLAVLGRIPRRPAPAAVRAGLLEKFRARSRRSA